MKYRLHDLLGKAHAVEFDGEVVLYATEKDRLGRIAYGTFADQQRPHDDGDYKFDPMQMVELGPEGHVRIQARDDVDEEVILIVILLKMIPWTDEDMK